MRTVCLWSSVWLNYCWSNSTQSPSLWYQAPFSFHKKKSVLSLFVLWNAKNAGTYQDKSEGYSAQIFTSFASLFSLPQLFFMGGKSWYQRLTECMYVPLSDSILLAHTHTQEEHIRALLAKPFKVPMADYVSSGHGAGRRGLGMRRGSYARVSLHDPFEENALVLYAPKELSAHEQLTADRWVWGLFPLDIFFL